MENELQRKPRMKGLTYLSITYQQLQSEEAHQNLLKHIVNNWALQGFRWNGVPCNLYDLANTISVKPEIIMDLLGQTGKNMGNILEKDQIENTIKSIITLSTTWAIQDRGTIMTQVDTLLKAQQGKYTPFVSAEVNKALKLILESNKNLMESYKAFFTGANLVTKVLEVVPDEKQENKEEAQLFLSPDEALQLIRNNNKELKAYQDNDQEYNTSLGNVDNKDFSQNTNPAGLNGLALKKLFEEHRVGDGPDVRERRSGTQSLMPFQPKSPDALKLESKHTNASRRRAEPEFDEEMLP